METPSKRQVGGSGHGAEGCRVRCGRPRNRQHPHSREDRRQLQAALNALVDGDELVITALSRLSRTQRAVINRLHDLQEKEIHVRTLDGLVNTKAMGKMAPVLIGLLTVLDEMERKMTRDRAMEGTELSTGRQLVGPLAVALRPIRQRKAWFCA